MTPIQVPDGVEDWLARTGPLHLLVGRLPDGWVDLTLTNATGRGEIAAIVQQEWTDDGTRVLTIRVRIPGQHRLPVRDPIHLQLESPRTDARRLTPGRPTIRVTVNPVTETLHIINNGTNLTGCGRRPGHGLVAWPVSIAPTVNELAFFSNDTCKKCLDWFRREYDA